MNQKKQCATKIITVDQYIISLGEHNFDHLFRLYHSLRSLALLKRFCFSFDIFTLCTLLLPLFSPCGSLICIRFWVNYFQVYHHDLFFFFSRCYHVLYVVCHFLCDLHNGEIDVGCFYIFLWNMFANVNVSISRKNPHQVCYDIFLVWIIINPKLLFQISQCCVNCHK